MYTREQVQQLFDEIEYYERTGKYKLADKVLDKLIKIAYQPKAEDIGKGGLGQAFAKNFNFNMFYDYIMTIPACRNLFGTAESTQAFFTEDYKDALAKLISQGMDIADAAASNQLQASLQDPSTSNLPDDPTFKNSFNQCMMAIGKGAGKFSPKFKDPAQIQQEQRAEAANSTPQSRQVPKM